MGNRLLTKRYINVTNATIGVLTCGFAPIVVRHAFGGGCHLRLVR
jgi:hypothetical protein